MEGWGQETQPPYKADTGLQSVGGWRALWSYRYKLSKMYPTRSVFDSCGSSSLSAVSAWRIKRGSLLRLHQLWVCEEERGILISERNILKQEISTQWRWRKCREEKKWVQMCFRDPRLFPFEDLSLAMSASSLVKNTEVQSHFLQICPHSALSCLWRGWKKLVPLFQLWVPSW